MTWFYKYNGLHFTDMSSKRKVGLRMFTKKRIKPIAKLVPFNSLIVYATRSSFTVCYI